MSAGDGDAPKERPAAMEENAFLSRWSRRKSAARREDVPTDDANSAADEADSLDAHETRAGGAVDGDAAEAVDEDALDDAALAERYGLKDPSTLSADDDFTPYMRPGAPPRLRNAALRKLWVSSPTLANIDGLLDYGEDFRTLGAQAVVKTAYEVGRGFAATIEAWEAKQRAAEQAAEKNAEQALGGAELKDAAGGGLKPGGARADSASSAGSDPDTLADDSGAVAPRSEGTAAPGALIDPAGPSPDAAHPADIRLDEVAAIASAPVPAPPPRRIRFRAPQSERPKTYDADS